MATTEKKITIPAMNLKHMDVRIVGDTPLIVHAWSEKAKRMMLEKQQKKASAGKEARNPETEFADTLYWLTPKPEKLEGNWMKGARFGFPVTGIKKSAIEASYQQGVVDKMTTLRGAFFITGYNCDYIEIEGEGHPVIREDMVKIGMGTADLRYRAMFEKWSALLHIEYNANAISDEQIINCLNCGGFCNGIGEWRPQRDGNFGRYHCESATAEA